MGKWIFGVFCFSVADKAVLGISFVMQVALVASNKGDRCSGGVSRQGRNHL
ncbi:hypothetical protein TIFTF001_017451 [Ficus carica]|uniref:Uncharacterized protein n=1 Tax=Ficus carica TaxID=3494 RepID=A0AA88AQT1_FICCA|nr:hypothetical protein TIFTF001_017451 [Ficus carica]